jgi:hypothetical protein
MKLLFDLLTFPVLVVLMAALAGCTTTTTTDPVTGVVTSTKAPDAATWNLVFQTAMKYADQYLQMEAQKDIAEAQRNEVNAQRMAQLQEAALNTLVGYLSGLSTTNQATAVKALPVPVQQALQAKRNEQMAKAQ